MKVIRIKVNPYSNKTTILVEGEKPREDSDLWYLIDKKQPLKYWVDDLPECISTTYNEMNYKIEFNGIESDYRIIKKELESRTDLINIVSISFSSDAEELKPEVIEQNLLSLLKDFSEKADILQNKDAFNKFNSLFVDYNAFLNDNRVKSADEKAEKISSIIDSLYDIKYEKILRQATIDKNNLKSEISSITNQINRIETELDQQSKIIGYICVDICDNLTSKTVLNEIDKEINKKIDCINKKFKSIKPFKTKVPSESFVNEYNYMINNISDIQKLSIEQLKAVTLDIISCLTNQSTKIFTERLKDYIAIYNLSITDFHIEAPELCLTSIEYKKCDNSIFVSEDVKKDKTSKIFKDVSKGVVVASTFGLASELAIASNSIKKTDSINIKKYYDELKKEFDKVILKNERIILEYFANQIFQNIRNELKKQGDSLNAVFMLKGSSKKQSLENEKDLISKKIEQIDSALNYFDDADKNIMKVIQDEEV
ncbi:MAG: hypothetical protein ACI4IH_02395 [Eubacterium sp.]